MDIDFGHNPYFESDLKSAPANVKSPRPGTGCHFKFGAFTLVELLVSLVVILILVSLILAGLSASVTRARSIQCVSRLKQIGQAMSVYGTDNSEFLPAAHSLVQWGDTNPVAWTKALFPQKTAPQILTCPSYREFYYQAPFSYFMGSRAAFVEAGAQPAPLPLRRILFPSQYILSGDCNFPFLAQDADPDNYTADALFGLEPLGHGHQVNVLFGDSHVLKSRHFKADLMTFSFTEPGRPWEQ